MRLLFVILFGCLLFITPLTTHAQKKSLKKSSVVLSSRQIANKVLPSVVIIITQDENGKPLSQGSGFVFSKGLIATNLHVFKRATDAFVKNVKTGEISKAIEVVAMNAKDDICVIRIDNPKFPAIQLGDSSIAGTGDEIYVASNPEGLEGSFTKGIISSVRKDEELFQIDAAISSGSSGGVLLNQKAEAIGIVKSSLVSGQNLNFAIPINNLKSLSLDSKYPILLAGACAVKDRESQGLKGLVKTVTYRERRNDIVNGELKVSEPLIQNHEVYDLEGNLVERRFYDIYGTFIFKYLFFYDENRISTRFVEEYASGKRVESLLTKEQGEYSKLRNRQFSGVITFEVSGREQSWVFNSKGEKISWMLNGKFIYFYYDSKGRVKEEIQTGKNGSEIVTRYLYKDDNYGNWIEQRRFQNFPTLKNGDPNEWTEDLPVYREITYH